MPQDAVALLEADHQRVETLFLDFQGSGGDPPTRLDLAQVICMELSMHSMMEEEVFYPAVAKATGDQQLVERARQDHQQVKDLIARVPHAKDLDALMAEMRQTVMQHVQDERRDMFPKAIASGMDMAALGAQMEGRHAEFAAMLHEDA
jgi:iron-sulfur cluster repair protein YtfE (RIC family)